MGMKKTYRVLCGHEEDSLCLSDAVRILGDSVRRDISVCLEIRRSSVVKDAIKEARKSKFNPQGLLKVYFCLYPNNSLLTRPYIAF